MFDKKAYMREYYQRNKDKWEQYYNRQGSYARAKMNEMNPNYAASSRRSNTIARQNVVANRQRDYAQNKMREAGGKGYTDWSRYNNNLRAYKEGVKRKKDLANNMADYMRKKSQNASTSKKSLPMSAAEKARQRESLKNLDANMRYMAVTLGLRGHKYGDVSAADRWTTLKRGVAKRNSKWNQYLEDAYNKGTGNKYAKEIIDYITSKGGYSSTGDILNSKQISDKSKSLIAKRVKAPTFNPKRSKKNK